jgi:protease-4
MLALVIFSLIVFFFFLAWVGNIASQDRPRVYPSSVLVINLSETFPEMGREDPFRILQGEEPQVPSLYDAIRLIRHAANDKKVEGILLQANGNGNGYAASAELRAALSDFKASGKFILAHADIMPQGAYDIASVANQVYLHPKGFMQWSGYHVTYAFFKGLLDKLEIEPQIFYAGKFKSATEPFRTDKMTDENRLQTRVWLEDLYGEFIQRIANARSVDSAELRRLAEQGLVRTATDALSYKLVDQLKYDDEVKDEIKDRLGLDKYAKINFISFGTYMAATNLSQGRGEKIALIVAEGNIVDGKGDQSSIGGDRYRSLLRKARLDQSVKAIVVRINSGGGSALASETIWREMSLARAEKPVIVSFGDVAASGGYYMAMGADSIFALPSTITGSIGVFGILPNMEGFFKNKLGISFDAVRTAPMADAGAIYRPLTEEEKQMMQAGVDLVYDQFKARVVDGRKLDSTFVDSIAQGRVWTGHRALGIGLIDRYGGISDAIASAAAMAELESYRVAVYPEPQSLIEQIFGSTEPMNFRDQLRQEMGAENFQVYEQLKHIREWTGVQARWPFVPLARQPKP